MSAASTPGLVRAAAVLETMSADPALQRAEDVAREVVAAAVDVGEFVQALAASEAVADREHRGWSYDQAAVAMRDVILGSGASSSQVEITDPLSLQPGDRVCVVSTRSKTATLNDRIEAVSYDDESFPLLRLEQARGDWGDGLVRIAPDAWMLVYAAREAPDDVVGQLRGEVERWKRIAGERAEEFKKARRESLAEVEQLRAQLALMRSSQLVDAVAAPRVLPDHVSVTDAVVEALDEYGVGMVHPDGERTPLPRYQADAVGQAVIKLVDGKTPRVSADQLRRAIGTYRRDEAVAHLAIVLQAAGIEVAG